MLAIRMQRTGRKGHAMFRVVVQDSHRTPTSGKIVAQLGSYDPHAKTVILDKEKAAFYLEHGAQPSERVVLLLKKEGVKLPKWVSQPDKKEQKTRNPEKRRSTRPDEPAEEAKPAEEPVETAEPTAANDTEVPAEEPAVEAEPAETETAKTEAEEEKPAEETKPVEEEKTAEPTEDKAADDKKSAE